ncbi:MAG TPA: serine hydrolase domain-containing protein [Caulobacteraceae bacterium]|jgi:CubicO group peptidase (beta-lactamase class C family)
MVEVRGLAPSRFEPAREVFARHFDDGLELGARFALAIEGEIVLDLMAGFADRATTRPFADDTLTPVYSTTKAIAALMVASLVDEGEVDYEAPIVGLWPEFADAGKDRVTIAEALSHQAGLPGFAEPMNARDWFDAGLIGARLAAMSPMWPPGTASGYHPVTFGYLAGEIFRRATGRGLGDAFRDDIGRPFGLDAWVGLPDSEHPRCAETRKPSVLPDLGPLTEPRRVAFRTAWAAPAGVSLDDWRRASIPSVTGHATAVALARMMSILACDGRLDGRQVLSPGTVAAVSTERIRGPDLVLPFDLSWGAGFLRNEGLFIYGPGEASYGHSGWGGSCAFADPERRLAGAYVMNRQSAHLIGDPRAVALIKAAYACL